MGEPNTSGHPKDQGFDEWFGYLNQRRAHSYYPDFLWKNKEKFELPENRDGKQGTYTHDLFTQFAVDFINRRKDEKFFIYLPYTVPHSRYEIPDTSHYSSENWTDNEKVHAAMITRLDRDIGTLFKRCKTWGSTKRRLSSSAPTTKQRKGGKVASTARDSCAAANGTCMKAAFGRL